MILHAQLASETHLKGSAQKKSVNTYLVALIDQLMGPCNELQPIDMIEFRSDLITEQPASTAGADGPCFHIFGITPNEIAKGALVRNLLRSRHHPNLIDSTDFRTEATVHA